MSLTEAALAARARRLGGRTLRELALDLGVAPPSPAHKGGVGVLVERALGSDAGSRPGPDFASLGIEVKTLPVDATGRPAESTFVCTVPRAAEDSWATSSVRAKLARVLWVPVEACGALPERRVGSAFLWSPSDAQEDTLRADWLTLVDLLASGDDAISARHGRALQLRPKARDAAARFRDADHEGAPILRRPLGYYLRRTFTTSLLAEAGFAPVSSPA